MANTFWIVIAAVVAVMVIAAVMWIARKQRDAQCRARADEIRERLRQEDAQVRQREEATARSELQTPG